MKPEPIESVNSENATPETAETEIAFNWSTPLPIPEDEPTISLDDSTPPIIEQAKSGGFDAAYYHFGKLEGDGSDYFNPAIVRRPDGYWMLTRRSEPHPQGFKFGQNAVWAFMLDDTGKVPKMGHRLNWPVDNHEQHFEDPRGFYHPGINQTCVGACTFIWYPDGTWTGAHQCFGAFDEEWMCRKMDYPKIGGNPGRMQKIEHHKDYEKNWLWWLHENELHLLYKANPWLVIRFGFTWTETTSYKFSDGGVQWAYGEIRGGTNPVRVGDLYFTFHHSSLPWRGRYRRYYAGCMAFDAAPPFRPRLITKDPLLMGSQNDVWQQRKPIVVFPCGAVIRDNKWLVSMGINDMRAGWMEIDHDLLLSKMSPVDSSSDTVFLGSGLSDGEKRNLGGAVKEMQYSSAKGLELSPFIDASTAQQSDEYRPRATKNRLTKKKRKRKSDVVNHVHDSR